MPREKIVGICSVCEQEKPLFDVKNKICGSCAGKKGGGRPTFIKKGPVIPLKASQVKTPDIPEIPADFFPQTGGGEESYLCDACNKPLRYGQRKCACGTWADWRNTPVEQDPDLVICDRCGAVCGHVGAVDKCPHCNQGE
jgi:hypothetical protein